MTVYPLADALVTYSNTDEGQRIEAHSKTDGKLLWTKNYLNKAHYQPSILVCTKPEPQIVLSFELAKPAGEFEFWGINTSGNGLWKTPVMAENGIFSYSISESPKDLVVADGEPGHGTIEFFELQ